MNKVVFLSLILLASSILTAQPETQEALQHSKKGERIRSLLRPRTKPFMRKNLGTGSMPLMAGMRGMPFNVEMEQAQEIMQVLDLVRKHKGNLASLVRDPAYQKIAPMVGSLMQKIKKMGHDTYMSLRLSEPFITHYANVMTQTFDDPHYASLLGGIAPAAKEMVALGRAFLQKLEEFAKNISMIDRNSAWKELIPAPGAMAPQKSTMPESEKSMQNARNFKSKSSDA